VPVIEEEKMIDTTQRAQPPTAHTAWRFASLAFTRIYHSDS